MYARTKAPMCARERRMNAHTSGHIVKPYIFRNVLRILSTVPGLLSSLQASATRRGARAVPASAGRGRTGRGGRTARARGGCVGCAGSERVARVAGGYRGYRRGARGVCSGVHAPVVEVEARAKHDSAAASFAREHAQHAGRGLGRAARRLVERV